MAKKKGLFGCFAIVIVLLLGVSAIVGFYGYNYVMKDNIKSDQLETELFIPTGADFKQVLDSIESKDLLVNTASFRQVAQAKSYPDLIKPGRYLINSKWNNLDLVDYLRAGKQSPVKLVINNVRLREELAGKVAAKLELDSLALLNKLNDVQVAHEFGFTKESFPAMFLANTYEMYWNTSEDEFLQRMKKEYDRFWTEERIAKAKQQNLTPEQAITLASIVEEETKAPEELPIVAGLYLNRLRKGMRLEADPTVKFAVGDFTIRRVLNKHLETVSPYNTYKNVGLPPGPIRIPELNAVNAVLNPKTHDFIFMCAHSDFSGRHAFARTLREHNTNANRYRNALNEREIFE